MTTPTADEIRSVMQRHVQFWNEGRFDEWMSLWPHRIELEDPVGTPIQAGERSFLKEFWDRDVGRWQLEITQLIVVGNEAAVAILNTGTVDGKPVEVVSIELYQFDDGVCRGRIFYEQPGAG